MDLVYPVFLLVLICQMFYLKECTSKKLERNKDYCRERKEFTFMSVSERIRFINVFKRVSTDPNFSQRYTQLVYQHPTLFDIVHNDKQFFPWHRFYLLQMENLLREADPSITLPYWDWSLLSASPWRNAALDIWTSLPWGLGGNGNRKDLCVTSGPFAAGGWRRARDINELGCLKRNFSGFPPDIMAVHRALRFSPEYFDKFNYYVSEFLHNALHVRVGGTLAEKEASLAPEFFLHHTFLDKIWSDYQDQSHEHKWINFRNANYNIYNTSIKAKTMMDNSNLLGIKVCYKDPFENYKDIHKRLRKYSLKKIRSFMNSNAFEYPFQDFYEF